MATGGAKGIIMPLFANKSLTLASGLAAVTNSKQRIGLEFTVALYRVGREKSGQFP